MLVTPLLRRELFLEKLERNGREVERQFTLLCDFFTPRTVFMHVGAADCQLAVQAGWVVVLALLTRLIWRRAAEHVVSQGG